MYLCYVRIYFVLVPSKAMKRGTYESRFYMAYSSFREQKLARLMRQCARGVIRGVLVFCSLGIPHMEVGTCDANTCQLAGLLRGRTETFAEVGLHLVPPVRACVILGKCVLRWARPMLENDMSDVR
jgi:hypothetical protein